MDGHGTLPHLIHILVMSFGYLLELHATAIGVLDGPSDVLATSGAPTLVNLGHALCDGLHDIWLQPLDFLDELPDLVSYYLIDGECHLDGDEPNIWVRVEKAGADQFCQDYSPVPSLRVDAEFLDYVKHDLQPCQDHTPLLLLWGQPLLNEIHDRIGELFYVHRRMPEDRDQTMKGNVSRAEVQL